MAVGLSALRPGLDRLKIFEEEYFEEKIWTERA
jgi:hypothetical protein